MPTCESVMIWTIPKILILVTGDLKNLCVKAIGYLRFRKICVLGLLFHNNCSHFWFLTWTVIGIRAFEHQIPIVVLVHFVVVGPVFAVGRLDFFEGPLLG